MQFSVLARRCGLKGTFAGWHSKHLVSSPGPSPIVTQAGRGPGMQRRTFYVTFNEHRQSKPQPAFQIMPPKPTVSYCECDIALQTNVFIASDKIVSVIHLQIRYDTADKRVYRYSNRQTSLVLETNIFGTKHAHVSRWWRPTR